jgi:hypothetical protein
VKKNKKNEKRLLAVGLNQKPILLEHTITELEQQFESIHTAPNQHAPVDDQPIDIVDAEFEDVGIHGRTPQQTPGRPQTPKILSIAMHKAKPKLVWKRKHVPPSIPNTHVYGYRENDEGELVPKNPPKPMVAEEVEIEDKKYVGKGYGFSKSRQRLVFKTSKNPGPNAYDPQKAEEYLHKKHSGGSGCIALAPNQRITDEIINTALKKVMGSKAGCTRTRSL